MKIKVLFCAVMLGWAYSSAAADVSFFLEVGQASYERPSGSLWQHEFAGYPTYWDTRPAMFRVGVDYKGFRVSYVDLGKYSIAAEASDEEVAVVACSCVLGYGDTDWYYTKGSIRAVLVTYKLNYKFLFVEAGPGLFRQAFKLTKDDGFYFQDKMHGLGHMVGVGVEIDRFSIGYYFYRTNIGGKFNGGEYPAGTGGANVVALSVNF